MQKLCEASLTPQPFFCLENHPQRIFTACCPGRGTKAVRGFFILLGCVLSQTCFAKEVEDDATTQIAWAVSEGIVVQQHEGTCAAASLATILRFVFGESTVTEQTVLNAARSSRSAAQWVERESKGLDASDIESAAHLLGYRAATVWISLRELARIKRPVIVYLRNNTPPHYTVLRGIDQDQVYLADPTIGKKVRLSIEQFGALWQDNNNEGIVVAVEPKNGQWPVASTVYLDNERAGGTLTTSSLTLEQAIRAEREVVVPAGGILTRIGFTRVRTQAQNIINLSVRYGASKNSTVGIDAEVAQHRGADTLTYSYDHAVVREQQNIPNLTVGMSYTNRHGGHGVAGTVTASKSYGQTSGFASVTRGNSTSPQSFGAREKTSWWYFNVGIDYQIDSTWNLEAMLGWATERNNGADSGNSAKETGYSVGIARALRLGSYVELSLFGGKNNSDPGVTLSWSNQFR